MKQEYPDIPAWRKEPEQILAAPTPFHLKEGWELVTENRNPSCSHAEIETLIQKRTINRIDLEIMKILAYYQCLNHYHIAFLLEARLHPGYRKRTYLDNLSKLKRAGIILCHIPVDEEGMGRGIPYTPASPLRLYTLSRPAFSYMEPLVPGARTPAAADGIRRLELAAANQFIIHFLHRHEPDGASCEYVRPIRQDGALLVLHALLRLPPVSSGKSETPGIRIPLIAVREHPGWEAEAAVRVHQLFSWLSLQRKEGSQLLPVAVVENISMATRLFAALPDEDRVRPLFYCPETLLMLYPPLSSLYRCEAGDDGKVTAVRLCLFPDVFCNFHDL